MASATILEKSPLGWWALTFFGKSGVILDIAFERGCELESSLLNVFIAMHFEILPRMPYKYVFKNFIQKVGLFWTATFEFISLKTFTAFINHILATYVTMICKYI